ncbi:Mom family adenine methylcarbamoylation protein [Hymenobacter cheonanensis]|uniref:Mom family adenine methylcarbamoylation protein n=1 Tax=Hymenobacter sp. CA2-7 TaxID=3063993 RepID=UPI0027125EE5|nr:hypothetical protein [Hymenobacter sp. CA2-7]MDO7888245.1 hypothetical protein [Hymenobacter sp. CA2-7]
MRIERASPAAISYACQHFHYAGRSHYLFVGYNAYNDKGEWCGVVCFARGAINCAKEFGLANGEAAELVRVALNGKQAATSQVVMAAVRQFAREAPLVQVLVSYADKNQGHVGTIYQATNWLYVGQTTKRSQWQQPITGELVHARNVTRTGTKRRADSGQLVRTHRQADLVEIRQQGKHKYLYPLTAAMRRQLTPHAQRYPKK